MNEFHLNVRIVEKYQKNMKFVMIRRRIGHFSSRLINEIKIWRSIRYQERVIYTSDNTLMISNIQLDAYLLTKIRFENQIYIERQVSNNSPSFKYKLFNQIFNFSNI